MSVRVEMLLHIARAVRKTTGPLRGGIVHGIRSCTVTRVRCYDGRGSGKRMLACSLDPRS